MKVVLLCAAQVVLGIQGEAFIFNAPAGPPARTSSSGSCGIDQPSSPPSAPCTSAWLRVNPLCSVVEPTTSEAVKDDRAAFFEEIDERQKIVTGEAEKYSRDVAGFYVVPGRITENAEFYRLFTYLLWKVDALIDEFPQWKTFLDPEAKVMPDMESLASYAATDVNKFGPVMDFVVEPQQTYMELRNEVESYFGSDASNAMEMLDKSICLYIKHKEDLAVMDTPESLMKKYSLEDYKYLRRWTGGAVPLPGCLWFGMDIPKDGTLEEACIACSLVNDLYDYMRDDSASSKQLRAWHYFDSVDDTLDYVRDYFYEVYDRVGPDLQLFLDLTMTYQQDRRVQAVRGFDKDWYDKLDLNFNHVILRKEQEQKQQA